MKNKKEIWLNPEEIKQLLEGGLFWKDIEPKLYEGESGSFSRDLKKEDLSIDDINWEEADKYKQQEQVQQQEHLNEDEQARLILLGEEKIEDAPTDQGGQNPVLKDRQINFDYFQEKKELHNIPYAAAAEEDQTNFFTEKDVPEKENEDIGVIFEENKEEEDEADESFFAQEEKFLFSRDIEPEEGRSVFSGLKLVLLLVITAALTFCLWFYFVGF